MRKVNDRCVSTAKGIYLCLLTIYAILRDVIPLYFIVASEVFSYGFFAIGVVFIAIDLFSKREMFQSRNVDWLIVFILICGISALVNYQHDLLANVKTIGWLALYFLLLYSEGVQKNTKRITAVFVTFVVTITILVVVSVSMYFFDVGYTYYKTTGTFTDQGFSFLYLRLWGLFQEANYAAVYTEVAWFLAVYLAIKAKKKMVTVIAVIQSLFFISFIVLSSSRTARLVLVIAGVWMGFYATYSLLKQSNGKKFLLSIGSAILAAAIVLLVHSSVTFTLPYVKTGIRSITSEQTVEKIQSCYDTLYVFGGVDIVESSTGLVIDEELPKPDIKTEIPPTNQPLNRTDLNKGDVTNGRLLRWLNGLEIFSKAPILGTSPRGVVSFAREHCPDTVIARNYYSISNSFLDILAGTGILGAVTMIAFLLLCAIHIIRSTVLGEFDVNRMLLSGLVLLVLASSVLESDLFFSLTATGVIFWYVLGILNGKASRPTIVQKVTDKLFVKR